MTKVIIVGTTFNFDMSANEIIGMSFSAKYVY